MVRGQGEFFGHFRRTWRGQYYPIFLPLITELTHPGQLTVFDVFLFDSDFKIERPTRYYRQGLHLLIDSSDDDEKKAAKDKGKGKEVERSTTRQQGEKNTENTHLAPPSDVDCISTFGSIRSTLSKVFKRKTQEPEMSPRASGSGSGPPPRISTDNASSTESTVSLPSERAPTPLLDPSTNTNPLLDPEENHDHPDPLKKRKSGDEMSKHTFYIENSQMKLKINAKNERQMLQWVAALEKATSTCHFTGRSRFDSFAPIRLNVSAQWLVDGVGCCLNISSLSGLIRFAISVIISGIFLVQYYSQRSRFTFTIGGCPPVIPPYFPPSLHLLMRVGPL